jgi:hypothetical protein
MLKVNVIVKEQWLEVLASSVHLTNSLTKEHVLTVL